MPELRERFNVASLGVFGSCLRGEDRARSDVDLLVEFSETPGFFLFVDLKDRLSEILGKEVDLVMKSALKPKIGERILREVIPV